MIMKIMVYYFLKDGALFLPGTGQKQTKMTFAEFVRHIMNAVVPIVQFPEINVH